jgi:hypothetical protein
MNEIGVPEAQPKRSLGLFALRLFLQFRSVHIRLAAAIDPIWRAASHQPFVQQRERPPLLHGHQNS